MTPPTLPIVDSHVHVWANDPAFAWAAETVDPPRYEAGPESLLASMRPESVAAAVLVQYIGYRWNNDYVAHALETFPGTFAGVCRVNPEDPAAPDQLSYWTEHRGFHGVRISPEADARGDWFSGAPMHALFRRAADLKIPVLVLTKPPRLPQLARILDHVPEVDVVIDHMADCDVNNPVDRQALDMLARNPRVFLKTGHVWANSAEDYPWRDQHALLKYARDLFGAQRIMWGSDWPLCLRRATYRQSLCYLRDETDFLSREELAWVVGGTARRLWKFPEVARLEKEQSEIATAAGSTGGDEDGDAAYARTRLAVKGR